MQNRIDALAAELETLRSEITELDAVEEPTEEQGARYDAALVEWDEKKAEHDRMVERAAKVEAVRSAWIKESNREVSAPQVVVRKDPFENLGALRFSYDDERAPKFDTDVVSRAITAVSDREYRGAGVTDEQVEAVVRSIETIPGAAQHALLHGSPAYREAFTEWVSTQGNPVYTPEQAEAKRAALALGGSTGGYTLPTLLDPTLIHTGTASKNPIRQIARVVSGTQNVWKGVSVNNVATYWHTEAAALTEGSPTFAQPSVTAAMLTAYLTGSFEIFEDSSLQAQLPGLIAEAFDYKESDAFVTGSGSNEPKGIVTAISATAGSTVTATTRGAFTSASAVDVFALLNSVPSRYEDNATWVANKVTFNTIKQMSTGSNGSYFWSDFNAAIGNPLLGSPIKQSSAMVTATTSGNVMAILGDFSQFVVYDRIGTVLDFVPVVVDGSGLPTGQRGLVAHKRVGSDVTDLNAFRFLKA